MMSKARVASACLSLLASISLPGCDFLFPPTFPVEIALQAPKGLNVSGASASFNGGDPYILVNGNIRVMVNMKAGEKLTIAVRLPDNLVAPDGSTKTFLLTEDGDGNPHPIRYVIPIEAKVVGPSYLLTLESECPGQEVSVNGEPFGKVDEDGVFAKALDKPKGEKIRITLAKTGACETRACDLTLGDPTRIDINAECPAVAEGADEPVEETPEQIKKREREEKERLAAEAKAQREAELAEERAEKQRLAEEAKAKREADAAAAAEAKAARDAAAKAEREEQARIRGEEKAARDAAAKAQREEQARLAEQSKAERDAAAKAKREADALAAAEAKAARDAAAKAQRDEQARAAAEAKERRDAEAKAKREADAQALADAKARREAEAEAKRQEKAEADAKAAELARQDKVKIPDQKFVQPKGSIAVKVSCSPAGMNLHVDGNLQVVGCGDSATAYVMPDGQLHSFKLVAQEGKPACDRAEPVVRNIPKKGQVAPITVTADCGDCLLRLRGMVAAKKPIADADLGCLTKVPPTSDGYLDAQLLYAHVLDTQKKDAKRAEEVLTKLITTAKGQASAEAYYRLADLVGRRKDFAKQREYADKAWTYRGSFSTDQAGENRMLGVRKQRAGAFEGLYYSNGDKGYLDKAKYEYTQLGDEAKNVAGSEKWTKLAKEGLARLEEQEKLGNVNLGNK